MEKIRLEERVGEGFILVKHIPGPVLAEGLAALAVEVAAGKYEAVRILADSRVVAPLTPLVEGHCVYAKPNPEYEENHRVRVRPEYVLFWCKKPEDGTVVFVELPSS